MLGTETDNNTDATLHTIILPVRITKRGVEQKLIIGADFTSPGSPDEALLTAIARAHSWVEDIKLCRVRELKEISKREGLPGAYIRAHLPLAFLAPSIVTSVIDGRQPADLSLKQLMYRTDLSIEWAVQRRQLGVDR